MTNSHHNSHKFKIIETTESQILTIGCGQSLRKPGASPLSQAQAPGGFQNYQNYFQNYHKTKSRSISTVEGSGATCTRIFFKLFFQNR